MPVTVMPAPVTPVSAVPVSRASASGASASGASGWSAASRCSGMLAGDVTSATVPWAKVNPVIAPQVLRLTSAVACDQDGLLLLTVRVGSPPSLGSLAVRQGLEDLLHLRVAGVAGILEQHARVLRGYRAGAGHPLLVHVGHECRPPLPA